MNFCYYVVLYITLAFSSFFLLTSLGLITFSIFPFSRQLIWKVYSQFYLVLLNF